MTTPATSSNPDGIYPGQTWASKYQTGVSVRVTVVTDTRVGFTQDGGENVRYLSRRKFTTAYTRVRGSR